MTRKLKAIIILLFLNLQLISDPGKFTLFKATFELTNKNVVTGWFIYGSYDSLTSKFTDESFKSFLENNLPLTDTILIYTKFDSLKYPNINGKIKYHYAVDKANIYKITIDQIKKIKFLNSLPFEWEPIIELSKEDLKLLRRKPFAQYTYIFKAMENPTYEILSYDPKILQSELQQIADRLKQIENAYIKDCKDFNVYKCYLKEFEKVKKEINSNKVVIFEVIEMI